MEPYRMRYVQYRGARSVQHSTHPVVSSRVEPLQWLPPVSYFPLYPPRYRSYRSSGSRTTLSVSSLRLHPVFPPSFLQMLFKILALAAASAGLTHAAVVNGNPDLHPILLVTVTSIALSTDIETSFVTVPGSSTTSTSVVVFTSTPTTLHSSPPSSTHVSSSFSSSSGLNSSTTSIITTDPLTPIPVTTLSVGTGTPSLSSSRSTVTVSTTASSLPSVNPSSIGGASSNGVAGNRMDAGRTVLVTIGCALLGAVLTGARI
ncbi:hypothetical protein D9757_008350 [Collybiopsis confluens]|uniref:Uncharacterized protein n=1 Tax=Collybiopsis confluens TaxID=2823264 RepID=A0A8H5HEM0_9AGAR|nr:hypothetical protein D9757_008350 [Collybiopsis confluens]